jgi:response regulator RpfG family c-di-GMP phosphodiesterase
MTTSSGELIRAEVEARILVVDDEPQVATLLADTLREADPGWHVEVETDPSAALDRLTEESFDCLVTDLVMPDMDGLCLARKARAIRENLAMVAVTGRASLDSSVEALRVGFADYIQKPFDLGAIRQSVSRCLKQSRQQSMAGRHLEQLSREKAALQASHDQLSRKLDIASNDLVLSSKRMIRQIKDVARVADVARAIMGVIEVEDLLGLCAEIIGDRVTCRTSTVALYETQENAVGLMVHAQPTEDEPPRLCWLPSPIRSGILCRAATSGKSIHIEDIASSGLVHAQEREFWRQGRLLLVPVPYQRTVVAVAVLHRAAEDEDFGVPDIKSVTEVAQVMGPAIRGAKAHHRQRCSVYTTLEGIAEAVDRRDEWMRGHSGRVLAYAMPVGSAVGLKQFQIGALQIAARLHDVGRLVIPDSAVNHKGLLTDEQRDVVRRHPEAGAGFLKHLDFFGEVAEIVRAHHESYDGTGYPDRKAGEEIPLVARVIAVADAFDAMTSPRPYRDAMDIDQALEQIRRLAGEQFDPRVAQALLEIPAEYLTEVHDSGR